MEASRPTVLSIAGFDPCAGAGLLADIKTFEQHKVYGLGISTAQTVQTEDKFFAIRWEDEKDMLQSLEIMLLRYAVRAIKIGIVKNINALEKITSFIHQKNNTIKIVIDPVISSSSGFGFWNGEMSETLLFEALSKTFLITPNYNEAMHLFPSANPKEASRKLAAYSNVLLKGGHNPDDPGADYLFSKNKTERLDAVSTAVTAKHGSGCVLSAAITANLALGFDLVDACKNAKIYTEQFLNSNKTLLGYHHV